MLTITCTAIMNVHKKLNFIVTVQTSARWVKPAQPAAKIFSSPTLLMGGACRATPAEPAS